MVVVIKALGAAAAAMQQGGSFLSGQPRRASQCFPWKAVGGRGLQGGGGALALAISPSLHPGTAGTAALSAGIMCHALP